MIQKKASDATWMADAHYSGRGKFDRLGAMNAIQHCCGTNQMGRIGLVGREDTPKMN